MSGVTSRTFVLTRALPGGSTEVTVSRAVVHAYPTVLARLRRAAATSGRASAAGRTSCGSSDTLSSTVTILPSSARRSISGLTSETISVGPASVTRCAARVGMGETVTWPPSRMLRLPSSRSSA